MFLHCCYLQNLTIRLSKKTHTWYAYTKNNFTLRRYDIAGFNNTFNIPLNTLVISEMILWVTRPNQQCQTTEGQWLVNQTIQTRLRSLKGEAQTFLPIYVAPWRTKRHLEDRAKSNKIEAWSSRPTCKTDSFCCLPHMERNNKKKRMARPCISGQLFVMQGTKATSKTNCPKKHFWPPIWRP